MAARTISNGVEVMKAHSLQTTLQLIRHRRQRFNSLTMDKACFNEEINFGEISILGFYRPFLIKYMYHIEWLDSERIRKKCVF